MHVLFQAVTSTGSSGTEWWKIAAAAAAPTVAFVGVLLAYLNNRRQLHDRRFDERFDARFGANFQNITKLMEQARSTLDEVEKSAAGVEESSAEAERITQTLQSQAQQSEEIGQKLEAVLQRANQVNMQLNQRMQKADADVEAISEARSSITSELEMLTRISSVLAAHSYKPRAVANGRILGIDGRILGIDLFADGGRGRPSLAIEAKTLAPNSVSRALGSGLEGLRRFRSSHEADVMAALQLSEVRYLLVIDDEKLDRLIPANVRAKARENDIDVVPLRELDAYIQGLPYLESTGHNIKVSQ